MSGLFSIISCKILAFYFNQEYVIRIPMSGKKLLENSREKITKLNLLIHCGNQSQQNRIINRTDSQELNKYLFFLFDDICSLQLNETMKVWNFCNAENSQTARNPNIRLVPKSISYEKDAEEFYFLIRNFLLQNSTQRNFW